MRRRGSRKRTRLAIKYRVLQRHIYVSSAHVDTKKQRPPKERERKEYTIHCRKRQTRDVRYTYVNSVKAVQGQPSPLGLVCVWKAPPAETQHRWRFILESRCLGHHACERNSRLGAWSFFAGSRPEKSPFVRTFCATTSRQLALHPSRDLRWRSRCQ